MQPQFSNDFLNLASNRIVNPIKTNQPYPWMAYLLIQEWKEPTKQDDAMLLTCTGAVLSRRYANDIKAIMKKIHIEIFLLVI